MPIRWILVFVAALTLLAPLGCPPHAPAPADGGAAAPDAPVPVPREASSPTAHTPVVDVQNLVTRHPERHARPQRQAAPAKPNPPDPRIVECIRVVGDRGTKADFMDCLGGIEREDASAGHKYGSISRPLFPCAAQGVPDWYVNPSTGNDANTCITSGSPCLTMGEIALRWGCGGSPTYAPVTTTTTTIHALANWGNNSDWMPLEPVIVQGGSFTVLCSTTTVCSGTLASVVAKTRAAGTADGRLHADLGACAAGNQGMMIVNTTRASSVAWIDQCSGTVCQLTQPVAANVPAFATAAAENDTWANTDAFNVVRPTKVNAAHFKPRTVGDVANAFWTSGFMGNCWVPNADTSSAADAGSTTRFAANSAVSIVQSRIDSYTDVVESTLTDNEGTFQNVWAPNGGNFASSFFLAGAANTYNLFFASIFSGVVTEDAVLHGAISFGQRTSDQTIIGPIWSDSSLSGSSLEFWNDVALLGDTGPGVIYGSYTLASGQLLGSIAALTYGGTAATAFAGVPTWEFCGGSAVASAVDLSHTPAQRYGTRTLSAAALDAPIGGFAGTGFGGLALCDNGAVVTNGSQTIGPTTPALVAGSGITLTTDSPAAGQLTVAATAGACPVGVACGGTGDTSLTNACFLVGQGTSPVITLCPGAFSSIPYSTGSVWTTTIFAGAMATAGYTSFFSSTTGVSVPVGAITQVGATSITIPTAGAKANITIGFDLVENGTLPSSSVDVTYGVGIDSNASFVDNGMITFPVPSPSTHPQFVAPPEVWQASGLSAGSHTVYGLVNSATTTFTAKANTTVVLTP